MVPILNRSQMCYVFFWCAVVTAAGSEGNNAGNVPVVCRGVQQQTANVLIKIFPPLLGKSYKNHNIWLP